MVEYVNGYRTNGRKEIYVISGGPGCGKTTLISGLKNLGYYTVPEAAEQIIRGEIECGGEMVPWNSSRYAEFQNAVYSLQKIQERRIPEKATAISDRSLWDVVAYSRFGKTEPPKGIYKNLEKAPYKAVFIPDRLPILERSEIRREDEEKARKLHEIIGEVYEESGLEVIKVPCFETPQERIDFVRKYIEGANLSEITSQTPTSAQSTA